ncbi:6-pyruvoyl trahydropterin synthase family protein [Mariniblastus fucicola]|uniref:6-carboxy-5,6,7,8-tetrahydropterin synthase n=1 Tax=Mariniblastus fucicola TaxID=980251 RepID=A0A5B9PE71_9BACT|nr:6-pyruvoyl tetrahydropterin synthase family protein [Mariniblastus fucicola]QEG23495.1 6-carboxy-5,6,7,8-tetrahydropterin synthase [Mariniblastus fucicola]
MTSDVFEVSLEKESLVFSSAHFITFNGNVCERLHGHNYRCKCRVIGTLDENGYVIDFIALRDTLQRIVGELDHHVLLPINHPTISVEKKDAEVIARFEEKRWVFPEEDCVLLPIANTTAELLAMWIADQLIARLDAKTKATLDKVVVSVDENHGQWASAESSI